LLRLTSRTRFGWIMPLHIWGQVYSHGGKIPAPSLAAAGARTRNHDGPSQSLDSSLLGPRPICARTTTTRSPVWTARLQAPTASTSTRGSRFRIAAHAQRLTRSGKSTCAETWRYLQRPGTAEHLTIINDSWEPDVAGQRLADWGLLTARWSGQAKKTLQTLLIRGTHTGAWILAYWTGWRATHQQ